MNASSPARPAPCSALRALARTPWRALLLAAAAALSLPAAAQAYRCESGGRVTFQQAPCGEGRRVAAPTAAEAVAVPAARGAALCERYARDGGVFVDPESLRLGATRYAGAKAWRVHEELIAARVYALRINARNEMGGYDGERSFECLLSEDEARVLHFGRAGAAAPGAR